MEMQELIPADTFCTYHNIQVSFISSLQEAGLISVTTIEGRSFLAHDQLNEVEKFIRLHYDLDINTEGLEAIEHMLSRMKNMQQEIMQLQAKLNAYRGLLGDIFE